MQMPTAEMLLRCKIAIRNVTQACLPACARYVVNGATAAVSRSRSHVAILCAINRVIDNDEAREYHRFDDI